MISEEKPISVWFKKIWRNRFRQPINFVSVVMVVAIILVGLSFLIFYFLFANRVLPNVSLSGHNFGGMTIKQVNDRLASLSEQYQNQPAVFSYQKKEYQISPQAIVWQVKIDETARRIFSHGRQGKIAERLQAWLAVPFKTTVIELSADYD